MTVTRAATFSTDATLSSLNLNNFTLDPTFASGTHSYTASVRKGVMSTRVTAQTTDPNATRVIKLDGVTDTDGTVALAVGENSVTVVVTAEDGATTQTYTVTVTRDAPLSNDATLSSLSLSDGTLDPTFMSGTQSYTASVANSVTSTMVTAETTDPNAAEPVIKLDGTEDADGTVDLAVGTNTITVTVTAEDTTTSLTYTVTVTRQAPFVCLAPDLSGRSEVWSGTVTVGTNGTNYGYQSGTDAYGGLSDTEFDYGGNDYIIEGIIQFSNPAFTWVKIDLDSSFPDSDRSKLSLHICDETFSLTSAISDTAANDYKVNFFSDIPASFNWPGATTVQLALSEPVTNTAAEGQPDISGAAQVDKTLTAEQGDIDDDDGLPTGTFPSGYTFEWVSVDALNVETVVGSGISYTVSSTDLGSTIIVEVSFTDGAGNAETVMSDPVGPVVAAARDSCPAGNDWEATLTMGYESGRFAGVHVQGFGFDPSTSFGDLDPTTIPHGSTPYTVTRIYRSLETTGNTINTHSLTFAVTGGELPDGTVLDLGGTEFTVGTNTVTATIGQEKWDLVTLGINPTWVEDQEMTVCANLPPGLLSAIADGTSLVLTYDQDLDTGSTPAASAYVVKVDGGTGATPSSVSVAGRTVTLTLASAVTNTNTVTLSYTAPASNPVQDGSGIAALSFTNQAVSNETTNLVLSRTSMSVGEAGSDTFTVKLATLPSGKVTVTVSSDDIGAATVSPASLTFTTTNWNTTQTVTVSGVDDSDTDNESLTVTASASGGGYNGKMDTVSVTVTDNDTTNLVLSRASLSVGEAGSDTFTVKLATLPSANVTVTVSSDDTGAATVSPASLTFTTTNWNTTQQVTVSGEDDSDTDNEILTVTASASGGGYTGKTATVNVTVTDDDTAETVPGAPRNLRATASGQTQIDLAWDAPSSNGNSAITGYKIEVSTNAGSSWSDLVADTGNPNDRTYFHTGLSAGTTRHYQVSAINAVGTGNPSNIANATTGVTTVTFGASSYTATEGGSSATVVVRLSQAPATQVTIPLTTMHRGGATGGDYTGIPDDVMFTSGQTQSSFTVTAVDDSFDDDGESVRIGFDELPSGYAQGSPAMTTVALVDDEGSLRVVVGFTTHWAHVGERRESESRFKVPVRLDREPLRSVTIPLVVTHLGGATAADYTGIPESVTFGPNDTKADFFMYVIPDEEREIGERVLIDFGDLPSSVSKDWWGSSETIEFVDDLLDSTVWFGTDAYTATEGGAAALVSIHLDAPVKLEPLDVGLVLRYGGGATAADHGTIPAVVRFAIGQQTKTITVAATNDSDDDDGESVTLSFVNVSGDRVNIALQPVRANTTTVSLADNDGPMPVTVSFGAATYTAREGGSGASVSVELDATPGRSVTVPLTTTHRGGATGADYSGVPSSVTFGSNETQQTFTVTATNDTADDDGESLSIGFGTLPASVSAGSPAVVALDDDDGSSVRRVRVGFDTGASIAFQVRESTWPSRITLSLNRVAQRTVTIPLVVTHVGGATAADYTGIPASVTFGPDQRRVGFRVYGTLDEEIETGEGLRIDFGTLPPGVRVDSRGSYETVEFVDTSTDVAATNDSDDDAVSFKTHQQVANNPATGAPAITGTAQVGKTLTADTSGIADTDGLENVAFTYRWLADDTAVQGATNATYTLVEADEGQFSRVNKLMHSRAPKMSHPRRVGSTYLLSGLVKCKTCNRALSGQDAKSGQFAYYVCQSIMKRGKDACDTPRLNARRFEELVVDKIRSNILTEGSITELVKVVDEEMDGIAQDQRKRLRIIEDELEDVKRRLGRIWNVIETSDVDMADASDRIKEHRERKERLEDAAADARAILSERRAHLDDVKTISAYAKDMRDFLNESELTERRAFIESFVKEIIVMPGDALMRYTVPMPDDSFLAGTGHRKSAP